MAPKARALLAPVPYMHLESGVDVCAREGATIFGSDAWGLFEERGVEEGAPVYIYESLRQTPGTPKITWQATFIRYIRHEEMRRPEQRRRPSTTEGPQEGRWVGFWEVRDLRRLSPDEEFPISDLAGEDGRPFAAAFVPHGPTPTSG